MTPLPPAQTVCVAQAIYSEARGESDLGKRAVGHVVLNRAKLENKKPCKVINEPGQFKIKHSYFGDAWLDANEIAKHLGLDPSGRATHFHTTNCFPRWGFKLTTRIGHHLFFRQEKAR